MVSSTHEHHEYLRQARLFVCHRSPLLLPPPHLLLLSPGGRRSLCARGAALQEEKVWHTCQKRRSRAGLAATGILSRPVCRPAGCGAAAMPAAALACVCRQLEVHCWTVACRAYSSHFAVPCVAAHLDATAPSLAGKEWTDFVHREDELVTVVSGAYYWQCKAAAHLLKRSHQQPAPAMLVQMLQLRGCERQLPAVLATELTHVRASQCTPAPCRTRPGKMEFTIGSDRCVVEPGDEVFIPAGGRLFFCRVDAVQYAGRGELRRCGFERCSSSCCCWSLRVPSQPVPLFAHLHTLLSPLQASITAPRTLGTARRSGCMAMLDWPWLVRLSLALVVGEFGIGQ